MKTMKKTYIQPQANVICIDPQDLIAESPMPIIEEEEDELVVDDEIQSLSRKPGIWEEW